MKLMIHGACGRMGREVIRAATDTEGIEIVAATDTENHGSLGHDAGHLAGTVRVGVNVTSDLGQALGLCDAAVDFSTVEGTAALMGALDETPRPLVAAVTALDEQTVEGLRSLSEAAPVMVAANLSMGAAVVRLLAARAAAALTDFDIEIVEAHHSAKADAPSGTARDIVLALALARDLDPGKASVYGRKPGDPAREPSTIGVHAVRGGTVTGEHQVMFLGDHERVTLGHSAESRVIFARGALRAAKWLATRKPGMYLIDDLVGESLGL